MDDQLQPAGNEQSVVSIKDLFYKYVRFLPLFIISIALGLFVAFVYLRYATLIYTATGSVVVQDDNSGGSSDRFEALFGADSKKNIQNEIEFLQSRQLMNRVVAALGLNFDYKAKGNIKELNVYKSSPFHIEAFEIYDSAGFTLNIKFENEQSFRIDESAKSFTFGQVFKNEHGVFRMVRDPRFPVAGEYKVTWLPSDVVSGQLVGNLAIVAKPNTGILVLSLETTNAQLAADVINQIMAEYQKATIDDKNVTLQQRLIFVNKEIDTVSRQVDSISEQRQVFLKRYNLFDPATQSQSYLTEIQRTNQDLQAQRQQLNNVYLIEGYLRSGRDEVPVPSSLGLPDATLNELVNSYNQAQLDRKSLLKTTPPGNLAVRQRDEIIDRLQKNIISNLANIKASFGNSVSSIQGYSSGIQTKLQAMPEQQRILTEFDRQLTGKLDIYKNLMEEKEKTAIQLASTISDIKVLQDAVVNNTPIRPNTRNVRLLAALIGLLIPALFIFVLELLNDKVTTRNDVERLTSAAVIGEVGHSYGKDALVVTSNNRSVVAEQFRIIRSNLQYVLNHVQKPVILVSSSFSGEGKSFVSTNIGAVMALAGKRTIILEFDIRKPKILSHLNMPKKPGLTNYMLGKLKLEDLPVPIEGYDNLFVLACGPVPPNPSELLLDPKVGELFEHLRREFDVVIVDTAPVGMVSDAMTLSKFADCTLYIVRQGHTFKKQVTLIDEFHREGKLPKVSIILNDVKIRSGYGYYGYGRYGYGHGYGSSYYDEEEAPHGLLQQWFGWMDTKKWKKRKK